MTSTRRISLDAPRRLHLTPPHVSRRGLIQVHRSEAQLERVETGGWRAKDRLIKKRTVMSVGHDACSMRQDVPDIPVRKRQGAPPLREHKESRLAKGESRWSSDK